MHDRGAPRGETLTEFSEATLPPPVASLGWSDFFEDQLAPGEEDLARCRISSVHRTRLTALSRGGPIKLVLPVHANTGNYAVGDWVLVDPHSRLLRRRLNRRTLLERHTDGGKIPQLFAANVDTLFIVTSCNADFNLARLERYLALANQSGADPVILLTKPDKTEDAQSYRLQAEALQRGLSVVVLDSRSADFPSPPSRSGAAKARPWR